VLLADTLGGEPLNVAHGAPLRLVAPAHYGYKNLKHLAAIEYWTDRRHYRFPWPYPNLMDHPRARVALEERARFLPAWLLRPFYRMVMPLARAKAARGLAAYERQNRGTWVGKPVRCGGGDGIAGT
jgi:DMSO/TMAO reductase YedYZ molybdopterin-dependent catalytic subunit